MGNKKIASVFLVVLLILLIIGFYLLNIWVELPKITRKPNGEGFIHQKINDEEILCYFIEGKNFNYDLRIKGNKIYVKYKETITLDKLDWLANLSSHAEDLKLSSKKINLVIIAQIFLIFIFTIN